MLQLSLALHFPRDIYRMLHRLSRHFPQLLRQLLRLFTPFFNFRVWPFKVECQVKICLILALGDHVADEATRVKIAEIDLRERREVS